MAEMITCLEKDEEAVACKALYFLLEAANKAITEYGHFVLILAGGNTPKLLYSLLKNQATDFSKWLLIYGDERCLPPDHPERNSVMVQDIWLNPVNFPASNHYIIPAEKGASIAAREYSQSITHLLPADFALLGIGEDGHTASLFPENLTHDLESNDIVISVNNAKKPPAERVSLGYQTLKQTSTICFLACGESKREIIKKWRKDPALPCNHIRSIEKTVLITDLMLQKYFS